MITDEVNKLVTPELSQKEVEIYLALLENGESSAGEVANITKIKRPTVYLTLETMHKKGLVSSIESQKVKKFVALDPENLREFFAEKIRALNDMMPKLKWLSNRLSKKSNIRYFSGVEGARAAYTETLMEPKSTIRSVGSIGDAKKILGERWTNKYVRERVKKRIDADSILTSSKFAKELSSNNKKQRRNTKFIDPKLLPKNCELNIFNHKISFASYGDDPTGIIIENRELAKVLETLYDLATKKVS